MAEKMYYTMGELAEMFDVKASLIRYWETYFGVLKPKRNKKGNRLFTAADVEYLKLIYHLVKERGMTLDGVKKSLRQQRAEGRGVAREMELMERLQHIRSLLLEVREDLKGDEGEVIEVKGDGDIGQLLTQPTLSPTKPLRIAKSQNVKVEIVEVAKATEAVELVDDQQVIDENGEYGDNFSEQIPEQQISNPFSEPDSQAATESFDDSPFEVESDAGDDELYAPIAEIKEVVEIDDSANPTGPSDATTDLQGSQIPAKTRRPRRKMEDAENKELFAYFEQSLF